ncbi:UDP-N-acetylmuramoylalanine--D-glutamate ligase [Limimonas halophila]|uniref:UDP-N-acetylmuramoylalanine--D-glutamate ligase n=1 Tax=Limimonas halophila TaxID=1082479 RepID=A0A1G7U5W2_9PROT|nr:UDP-N-acetylmuramoyl-L-alanine--D-glutamate ligase [Limimonas halophila]SDG42804.1 UDP-N-acetylmuramoylalanine--D-glutamate ligase [Limimonas halophila]
MIPLAFAADRLVAVFGLGTSGLAAARALHESGARVLAWDDDSSRREAAQAQGVPLTHPDEPAWGAAAFLVLSPGIPDRHPESHPVAARARANDVPIVSDVELLARAQADARFVGVTGTNGKSTTTALIGHILDEAGAAPQVGGNLGRPALAFEPAAPNQPYVLEMSSYQLERTASATFDVAVLLNISPDHLDRHGGMDGYVAAKRRIFEGQRAAHTAVVGVDDARTREIARALRAADGPTIVPVSASEPVPGGVSAAGGVLIDDLDGERAEAVDLRTCATLPGAHNWQNAAAAYAACRRLGVARETIAAALNSYPGLAHRQEVVAVIDGVAFVNDSKATNADAAARALASYPAIYWIVGGRAKDGGLTGTEAHWGKVCRAYTIGEAADSFRATLADTVPTVAADTLDIAVHQAAEAARADGVPGAVVLLSPACASFDQYADFAGRGDHFRALVADLPGTRERLTPAHLGADTDANTAADAGGAP